MMSVVACDPELPPLEMISGTKRASTTAFSISFSKKPIAVAVSNSPRNNTTSQPAPEQTVTEVLRRLHGAQAAADYLGLGLSVVQRLTAVGEIPHFKVGQINVSTKPGGNEYHGTLFEFLRNSDLDAEPFAFTQARPPNAPFRWNQFGFTLGGPIWIPKIFNGRNRLFFMSNYEGFRDRKQLRLFSDVPSLAMRNGDFSQIRTPIFDPATHLQQGTGITAQPFPNNMIPQNRLAGLSIRMLQFLPMPNQPGSSLSQNFQIDLAWTNGTGDADR